MTLPKPIPLPVGVPRSRWREHLTKIGGVVPLHAVHPVHAAHLLRVRGESQLAVEALYDLLSREPYHVDGLNQVVSILASLGREEDARPLRRRLHELRCRDLGLEGLARDATVDFLDSAFGLGVLPKRAPVDFVRSTFDRYADFYDVKLRTHLGYRAPELVREAITTTAAGREQGLELLEIGCGTGLVGSLVRNTARRLVGVDVSSRMLERARERDFYDELIEADFITWLEANRHKWDLVIAADVLCYHGHLGPLMQLISARLASMGRFVFTVERGTLPVALQLSERFVHSEDHVRAVAEAAQLDVTYLVERALRTQNGRPVSGYVVVLQRRTGRPAASG